MPSARPVVSRIFAQAFGRQSDLSVSVMPGPVRLSLISPSAVVPVMPSITNRDGPSCSEEAVERVRNEEVRGGVHIRDGVRSRELEKAAARTAPLPRIFFT